MTSRDVSRLEPLLEALSRCYEAARKWDDAQLAVAAGVAYLAISRRSDELEKELSATA